MNLSCIKLTIVHFCKDRNMENMEILNQIKAEIKAGNGNQRKINLEFYRCGIF